MVTKTRLLAGWAIVGFLGLVCSGCTVDVDLQSSPPAVGIGMPVTHDITVTNLSTCPVGNVTTLLFPFVPKDIVIDRIQDPELREFLRGLVEAFCTGQLVTPPTDLGGNCERTDGDLVCTFHRKPQSDAPGDAQESVALFKTNSGDEVTCGSAGSTITCRIPKAIVAMGDAVTANAAVIGVLPCQEIDGVIVCFTLKLDPAETKAGTAQAIAQRSGFFRNWIVTVAGKDEGVCTGGLLKGVPCEDNGDCPGMTNTCGSGICVGGAKDGFGCNALGDCPGGTECLQCDVNSDGQLLPGLACTTTVVGAPAPAMSTWALGGLALLMVGAAGAQLRRRRLARR